ncbi:hypothetical protein ACJ73_04560 [Blastomyces percursus]|uniref:AAA+ ATPase domain-containing protein n=1 Tax=Blastomyces percursus TaxID=1658174 RepID=A0A1J9R6E6_9EURO|nr:hypothetical protein ACJ73_04560 [Blastomyces percursus]
MEPLSLAVGFAGLAGLFSTCVDCFKLVQVYDSRASDYGILQTMLDNQQFHFMAWGKACGFMDPYRKHSKFDDPTLSLRNERIEQTMEKIKSLLTNGDNLKEMYGLKVQRPPLGSKFMETATSSAFSRAFQTTKAFCNTSLQRRAHIFGSIRWVVSDRDKFDRLVQNIRDLLGDLTKFTEDIGVTESQHLIVEYEIEMIDDEPSLAMIAAASACDGDDDVLSQAASRRLQMVKEQSIANQSVRFDDSVSMASAQYYSPSMSTLIEDEDGTMIPEIGVTRVPLSEWRKMKTRTGIIPWLKILIVATSSSTDGVELQEYIQPLSRTNTLSGNTEPVARERLLRIAINSHALLSVLKKVTGCNLTPKHNVLVYPFKPIILFYDSLRNYLTAMHDKLGTLRKPYDTHTQEETAGCVPGQPKPVPEDLPSKHFTAEQARRAFEELGFLMNFVDNDMQELLHIRRQIRENELQQIHFEHLWLLFQPGVIVISPNTNSKLRAYQVLHVTGGRRIIDVDNHSKSESPASLDNTDYDNQEGYAVISTRQCSDFFVDCFYIDFNGEKYGPRPQRFVISEFVGERSISSLPIYPSNQSQINEHILDRLRERGQKFVHFSRRKRLLYNGAILQEWDPGHRDTCGVCARNYVGQEQRSSEVIIDHVAALEHCKQSGCTWNPSFGGNVIAKATKANRREAFDTIDCSIRNCRACTDVFNDGVVDLNSRDQFIRSSTSLRALHQHELEDEQVLLLPNRLCGYSLQSHKWYPLYVDRLIPTEAPSTSLHEIILPPGHKEMLTSLVRAQSPGIRRSHDDSPYELDIIVGRRRGVIILLHGAPGTGKTATAAALASSLNRPLFLIRIAALGTTSREMEQNLTQLFQLAERWDCIILIREVDTLLQSRTRTDREGDNMSSVFLDALEYFTGIIIFTTNRVSAFDETIMSRIHISLYYPPLDTDATMNLWELNLCRLKRNPHFRVEESSILKFARAKHEELRCTGRQIKNIVDTAVALAQEDSKQLSTETVNIRKIHFEVVFRSNQNFHEYITALHGNSNDYPTTRELLSPETNPTYITPQAPHREQWDVRSDAVASTSPSFNDEGCRQSTFYARG